MPLHIIKNYTGKPIQREGKVIDTTLKATRLCKDTIADNLRFGNPELITVIVISPSIFRHFQAFLEHPAVTMEGVPSMSEINTSSTLENNVKKALKKFEDHTLAELVKLLELAKDHVPYLHPYEEPDFELEQVLFFISAVLLLLRKGTEQKQVGEQS